MSKVLVVDDSEFMRKVLRNILEAGGHKVIEARNANEALDRYVREGADVITMDIVMPDLDGIEAVKRLKGANKRDRIIMNEGSHYAHGEESRDDGQGYVGGDRKIV